MRTVVRNELFLAFCRFASRVPYEAWVLPIYHNVALEEEVTSWEKQLPLARLLKSAVRRLTIVAKACHLVLHTLHNLNVEHYRAVSWQILADDYPWHVEILPIIPEKSRCYSFKEVHFN